MTDVLPPDTPDEVGVSYIAEMFGISRAAVIARINGGDLPARKIPGGGDAYTYIVRPTDAALIWGHKLRKKLAAAAS